MFIDRTLKYKLKMVGNCAVLPDETEKTTFKVLSVHNKLLGLMEMKCTKEGEVSYDAVGTNNEYDLIDLKRGIKNGRNVMFLL